MSWSSASCLCANKEQTALFHHQPKLRAGIRARQHQELHTDAFAPGSRVVVMDDLIATGGTMLAACQLIQKMDAEVVEVASIIDLPALGGSQKLRQAGFNVFSLCEFEEH